MYRKKPRPGPGVKNKYSRSRGKGNYTEHWRDSYEYRYEYFKSNPGLFNKIWFCGICGGPIYGKENVQVDHIFPPSRVSRKKYDKRGNMIKNSSVFAEMLNTKMNLVAAHATCNRQKSDKVSMRYIATGLGTKVVSSGVYAASTVAVAGSYLALKGAHMGLRLGVEGVQALSRTKSGKAIIGVFAIVVLFMIFIR